MIIDYFGVRDGELGGQEERGGDESRRGTMDDGG